MSTWNQILFRITSQREKRIDDLLDRLAAVDAHADDVRVLRDLITSEVKASQRLRNITLVTVIGLVVIGFFSALWIKDQDRERAHALQYYQTSNLPVYFQNASNGDLRIRFDDDPDAPEFVRSNLVAINQNQAGFGRHPDLGVDNELKAVFDPDYNDGIRYILRPGKDSTTIGQITLTRRSGILSTQERAIIPGGSPRTFESLRNFALRIDSFHVARREWRIRFCERASQSATFTCTANTFEVAKSKAGRQQEHLLVTDPRWSGVYFVSVGFGEQGEQGKVWTVNARATKLGLYDS